MAVRRNWLRAGAAALLFLTLLGGIVTTFYHARRSERRFDQARGIARALLYDVHESIQPLPASIDAQQVVFRTAKRAWPKRKLWILLLPVLW